MAYRDFSIAQKVALAVIVMGSIVAIIGAAVPSWALLNEESFDGGKGSIGLWMYCGSMTETSKCEFISWSDIKDGKVVHHIVRIGALACVAIGGLSAIIGLSMACCCQGTKTICVGITCFVAGVCGAIALGIFISKVTDFVPEGKAVSKEDLYFGWGLIVFAAGFSVQVLVSFVACFASPNSPVSSYLVNAFPTAFVSHAASNTSSRPV